MAFSWCPEQRETCAPLLHMEASYIVHDNVEFLSYCHLSLAWISKQACFVLLSSGYFALVRYLVVEQLVLPAQILSDRSHALIPQQCL
jgi:hypothetical protein